MPSLLCANGLDQRCIKEKRSSKGKGELGALGVDRIAHSLKFIQYSHYLAMANRKIIIVQTKSYDSLIGGDGLYIDGIRKHLQNSGFEVCTLTSNPSKDRPRLMIALRYGREAHFPRKLRGTVRVLDRYFLVSPVLISHAFLFLARKVFWKWFVDQSPAITNVEINWIRREVVRSGATNVLLCFEAAHSMRFEDLAGVKVLHLYGFLNKEQYTLGSDLDTSPIPYQDLLGATEDAGRRVTAAFSSRDEKYRVNKELDYMEAIFIGMGMSAKNSLKPPTGDIALFVGNKTQPNHDSLEYFLQRIWPLVRKERPGARLWVIGRIGHWFSSDLPNGIEMKGEVDDISEYYWHAKLVVAPLVGGSAGVKTKIAEAISHGRAIVTTSIGVDRFDPGQLSRAGFVEDCPVSFAKRVIEIFADDLLRKSLEAGTHEVFESLYSESASYSELDEWLR